jgi:hypothetical protein
MTRNPFEPTKPKRLNKFFWLGAAWIVVGLFGLSIGEPITIIAIALGLYMVVTEYWRPL